MSNDTLSFDDPRVKVAEDNACVLKALIYSVERHAPNSPEKWLVLSLLMASRRAFAHLRKGWPVESAYTAWACRNLLELRIFAKYIVLSPENQKRFMYDFLIDSEQTTVMQKRLAGQVSPSLNLEQYDILMQNLASKKAELGFAECNYLKPAKLAKQMGLCEEFEVMNKLCSKLVHPTVQSILSADVDAQPERDLLFLKGRDYLADLMREITPFAQSLCVEPPETD
jgi:hypothetical protein